MMYLLYLIPKKIVFLVNSVELDFYIVHFGSNWSQKTKFNQLASFLFISWHITRMNFWTNIKLKRCIFTSFLSAPKVNQTVYHFTGYFHLRNARKTISVTFFPGEKEKFQKLFSTVRNDPKLIFQKSRAFMPSKYV